MSRFLLIMTTVIIYSGLSGCESTADEPDYSLEALKAKQAQYELISKCQAALSEQKTISGITIYVRHGGHLVRCRN